MGVLDGRRVVVTRAAHQAEELAGPLRQLGAHVILLPTIGIAAPLDPAPLRAAASRPNDYDWIVFTSVNAIEAFTAEVAGGAANCKPRIATIGSATREAAERCGLRVSIMPAKYVAESLVDAFRAEKLDGLRVLVPSAAVTRDVVATELRKRGADVTVVEAYRNVVPREAAEQALLVFREPYPDWVTFASSSAVASLARLVGSEVLRHVNIATIGPVTSETVRANGLLVAAEAVVHDLCGIVCALCDYERERA